MGEHFRSVSDEDWNWLLEQPGIRIVIHGRAFERLIGPEYAPEMIHEWLGPKLREIVAAISPRFVTACVVETEVYLGEAHTAVLPNVPYQEDVGRQFIDQLESMLQAAGLLTDHEDEFCGIDTAATADDGEMFSSLRLWAWHPPSNDTTIRSGRTLSLEEHELHRFINAAVHAELIMAAETPVTFSDRARVTSLNFSAAEVTDQHLRVLADPESGFIGLQSLDLSGYGRTDGHGRRVDSGVTDWGVGQLARADTGLKSLKSLTLCGTRLTDGGLRTLARPDSGLKALTALDIRLTQVSDEGVLALTRSDTGLNALATLDVSFTNVSHDGERLLRHRWPHVRVNREEPCGSGGNTLLRGLAELQKLGTPGMVADTDLSLHAARICHLRRTIELRYEHDVAFDDALDHLQVATSRWMHIATHRGWPIAEHSGNVGIPLDRLTIQRHSDEIAAGLLWCFEDIPPSTRLGHHWCVKIGRLTYDVLLLREVYDREQLSEDDLHKDSLLLAAATGVPAHVFLNCEMPELAALHCCRIREPSDTDDILFQVQERRAGLGQLIDSMFRDELLCSHTLGREHAARPQSVAFFLTHKGFSRASSAFARWAECCIDHDGWPAATEPLNHLDEAHDDVPF